MDVPKEKESVDELKRGDRSARNRPDERLEDEVTTHEVFDDFHGKKNHLGL